jgi:hypothetical protein
VCQGVQFKEMDSIKILCTIMLSMLAVVHSISYIHQQKKNVTVCITPKIGCSESLDYIRWMEVGPPRACVYSPLHIPNWRVNCTGSYSFDRYSSDSLFPLLFTDIPGGLSNIRSHSKVVILYRDPWKRLLSGYQDKFLSDNRLRCKPHCLQLYFHSDLDYNGENTLQNFFIAMVTEHESGQSAKFNKHFLLQSEQCLSEKMLKFVFNPAKNFTVRGGDIDKGGHDEISSALGHYGNDSLTSMLGHSYSERLESCFDISASVLGRVLHFLSADYKRIAHVWNVRFETESLLREVAVAGKNVIVCTHNKTIIRATDTNLKQT